MKKGFARTAADGIESFKIALPLLTTRLQYHGYYLTGDLTADALYYFVHDYINDHMSPAEFESFFGEGSCAESPAYVMAMFDALFYGISAAESVKRTYEDIGNRYVEQAAVLAKLAANGDGRRTVRITLTGSLLDVHDVLPEDRTISYTVDGPFDVTSDLTACLFLSLAFEKVHAMACPMSRVARELKKDMRVKRCLNSGKCHIASDTFFGLRIKIEAPERQVSAIPTVDALHKRLLEKRWAQSAITRATAARVGALLRSFQAAMCAISGRATLTQYE